MTLVEFLLARLDEDAFAAEFAQLSPGTRPRDRWRLVEHRVIDPCTVERAPHLRTESRIVATVPNPSAARHIARFDPARVLAECEAKRRIIEWVTNAQRYAAEGQPGAFDPEDARALTHALRLLALPYADHPDYREEWRP